MPPPTSPHTNPSSETIPIGPLSIHFLLSAPDTNASASVFELHVPAGAALPAPPHKNDAYEEILYGIRGVLTWTVDGTPIPVGPGQALCIRRGQTHAFANPSPTDDALQLAIITPAIMGPAYFREASQLLAAAAATNSRPNPATMTTLLHRHGMTVVPPSSSPRAQP